MLTKLKISLTAWHDNCLTDSFLDSMTSTYTEKDHGEFDVTSKDNGKKQFSSKTKSDSAIIYEGYLLGIMILVNWDQPDSREFQRGKFEDCIAIQAFLQRQ